MPRIRYILFSFLYFSLIFAPFQAHSQVTGEPDCHNGWNLPPEGRLHILVIFAEINFDSAWANLDPIDKKGTWLWQAGKLPEWKDELIATTPEGSGWMTDYFRQASFGKYEVTGDYVNQIVTVNLSDIRNNQGRVVTQEAFANNWYKKAVVDKVNSFGEIQFAGGSSMSDFDNLTLTSPGFPKLHEANGKTDLVMLVFRNIHVANLGESSGFVTTGSFGELSGVSSDMFSIFRTSTFLPKVIMRHEFSHMLYGGNNFHTANGGVGQRAFMSTIGGWSNMSASDACSPVYNAWDRERLSWQNPENEFLVNCHCAADGRAVNGVLDYSRNDCPDDIYVLRDFVTTGDAIKIPLPHLPDGKKGQYLWLENHQEREGFIDHDKTMTPGLYAYMQVGKDVMTGRNTFGDDCNYIWPLVGIGNYDFGYDKDTLILDSRKANPFTGYHFLMRHTMDLDGDGKIRVTTDMRPRTEYILPKELYIDGERQTEDYFTYETYPIFGTRDIRFSKEQFPKIGISHNPAAVPLYTMSAPKGPRPHDNQRIYLNGLSVELLRTGDEGEIYLKIRHDDFDIEKDVRWCGNILLTEKLNVQGGKTIKLAQGESAQLPDSVQTLNGKVLFARPTLLEFGPGSETVLEDGATLDVKSGSGILIRAGASVTLGKKAEINLENGAWIYIEQGASIRYSGKKGKFNLSPEAKHGISPYLIDFVDPPGPEMAEIPPNKN